MTSVNGRPGSPLASRLRDLREHEWPDVKVTQADLADAFKAESKVASATVSTWENVLNPKIPPAARLTAYARFFATRRSLAPKPHLIAVDDLGEEEQARYEELRDELLQLHASPDEAPAVDRRLLLSFEDTGPVVIVCPEAPEDSRGPLADEKDPNYTRLHRFADADALIEVFGHIRALNPDRPVLRRLPSETGKADLQNHLVILGGIGWNTTLQRIQAALRKFLPIEQIEDPALDTGEIFRIQGQGSTFRPEVDELTGELTEDVGLIARIPNPFHISRTLTICNGVHSTGVLGAVLALTDETVRPANETYLSDRFPRGEFAMLIRVPVILGEALAPDLKNPDIRLFEWSPTPGEE